MSHQVFIERCRDERPETAQALARAIAARYGIEPAQIAGRLAKGRFQVKANLDLDSARRFVSYLEGEGALCTVVDGMGQIVMQSARLSAAAGAELRDEISMPEVDDEFALHTPPPPPDYSSDYESGLSAASGSAAAAQTLGALDDQSASHSFSLATLDGKGDEGGAGAGVSRAAIDHESAFLPPEMQSETALELDTDSALMAAQSRAAEELSVEQEPGDTPEPQAKAAPLPARVLGLLSRNERARFAAGVMLAVLLSFVAVHFFAASRESSRYEGVLTTLREEYAAADTPAAWQALDDARDHAQTTLHDRRTTIVVTSTMIWLVLAALLVFVWMRLVDWSRFEALGLPEPRS